jgi:hypothetical protein
MCTFEQNIDCLADGDAVEPTLHFDNLGAHGKQVDLTY